MNADGQLAVQIAGAKSLDKDVLAKAVKAFEDVVSHPCENVPMWHDEGGFTCNDIYNLCATSKRGDPVRMRKSVDGITAQEACCACGDGKILANSHEYTPEEIEEMKRQAAE